MWCKSPKVCSAEGTYTSHKVASHGSQNGVFTLVEGITDFFAGVFSFVLIILEDLTTNLFLQYGEELSSSVDLISRPEDNR